MSTPQDASQRDERVEPRSGRDRLTRVAAVFYAAMIGLAVAWRVGLQGEPMFFVSEVERAAGVPWLRDGGIGIGVGLMVVWVSHLFTRRTDWGRNLEHQLAAALGHLSLPQCLLLAAASGIGEEFFFRGALQPVVGLGWASLLFGLMHVGPGRAWLPWTGFALIMGVIFGALFLLTGNLLAPVLAHAVINGVNLPLLVRRYGVSSAA